MTWAIILHGGASEIAPERQNASRVGCLTALSAGQAVLERGGAALDAVEAAVRILEDDPTFNAGFGSVLNSDGEVEMDAAIMDGATLDVGGVAAVKGVRHPVSVARMLLREKPILLVAEGARRFAQEKGAEVCAPRDMISLRRQATVANAGHDTVGCVAIDRARNIAAAASTGGLSGKMPGRVGDSPLPGCGLYADDDLGGVCLSGEGERIARAMLAARAMVALETQDPQTAADQALERLRLVGGEAGAIVLDRSGRIGWAHNSPHFAVAYATEGRREPRACLSRAEERASQHG